MPKYYGCPCEGCGRPLALTDDIVVCPDCGAPYHRECYEKLGRCIHTPTHGAGYEWTFPYKDDALRTCPSCGERTLRTEERCRCCGAVLPPESQCPEPPTQSQPGTDADGRFDYNDLYVNGVVKVSAKDLGTGREQNITITGSTNLSENEIQRAMADAAAYEAEDSRRKERLDLHNQAEVLAYKVDEALSKCKKELDKDEKNRIKTDLANLRRCLRKDKPEKMNENEEANLRQAKTQLEESANHLMVLYTSEQETDGTNNAL